MAESLHLQATKLGNVLICSNLTLLSLLVLKKSKSLLFDTDVHKNLCLDEYGATTGYKRRCFLFFFGDGGVLMEQMLLF